MRYFNLLILSVLLALAPVNQTLARGSHSSSSHSSSQRLSHSSGDVYVHGYTKKNGTYVAPHFRSHPDHSYNNNWSVKGNVNPHTGKAGTKNPTPDDRPPPKTPTPPSI